MVDQYDAELLTEASNPSFAVPKVFFDSRFTLHALG
jgi:hypothetical protein